MYDENGELVVSNPPGDNALRFVKTGAVVGGTAALFTVGADLALRNTRLSYATKGLITTGVGVASGLAVAPRFPNVGVGLVTGGILGGVRGVAMEMEMRQYLANATGARGNALQSSTTSGSGTTTAAAGLPGRRQAPYGSLLDHATAGARAR